MAKEIIDIKIGNRRLTTAFPLGVNAIAALRPNLQPQLLTLPERRTPELDPEAEALMQPRLGDILAQDLRVATLDHR